MRFELGSERNATCWLWVSTGFVCSFMHGCDQTQLQSLATYKQLLPSVRPPLPPPPPPHTRRAVPGVQYTNNGADEDNHSLLTETESEIDLEEDVQSIASSLEDRLT